MFTPLRPLRGRSEIGFYHFSPVKGRETGNQDMYFNLWNLQHRPKVDGDLCTAEGNYFCFVFLFLSLFYDALFSILKSIFLFFLKRITSNKALPCQATDLHMASTSSDNMAIRPYARRQPDPFIQIWKCNGLYIQPICNSWSTNDMCAPRNIRTPSLLCN